MNILRAFGQVKGHDKPLIQTVFNLKGSLSLITFAYMDLVVPTTKINLQEDARTSLRI